jgi:leucyl aminopeptidase
MRFTLSLGALVATNLLVSAAPAAESLTKDVKLRLIKTSESEATWVTEEEKITKYVAKNINFIDVTDIKVSARQL